MPREQPILNRRYRKSRLLPSLTPVMIQQELISPSKSKILHFRIQNDLNTFQIRLCQESFKVSKPHRLPILIKIVIEFFPIFTLGKVSNLCSAERAKNCYMQQLIESKECEFLPAVTADKFRLFKQYIRPFSHHCGFKNI